MNNNITDLCYLYQKIRLNHNLPPVDILSLHVKLEIFSDKNELLIDDMIGYGEDTDILAEISEIYWNYDTRGNKMDSEYKLKWVKGKVH
jgi:hypothetical protein